MGAARLHADAGAARRLLPRGLVLRVVDSSVQAVLLATKSDTPQTVFAVIFAIISLGAIALTLNVLLLVRARHAALGSCTPPARARHTVSHAA